MLVKVCTQVVQPIRDNSRIAGVHERKIVPVDTKEFRYLRFRAIGNMEVAGPNGNHDGFPYEHFEDERPGYGWRSFIGKRAHTEHNSAEGLAGSIGDLPDAYLNRFIYPDDVPHKWTSLIPKTFNEKRLGILGAPGQKMGDIEVLMRIDTQLVRSAKLNTKTRHILGRIVRMIDTGQKLTCSMGANVAYSDCSTCGNRAKFAHEYCDCLSKRKGAITVVGANSIRDLLDKERLRPEWLKHTVASLNDVQEILKGISNKGVAVRNNEINHEASFFELSVVGTPAYAAAEMLEKLARKQTEDKKEYIKRIAKELGNDGVLELYSFLQEEGLISTQCSVR